MIILRSRISSGTSWAYRAVANGRRCCIAQGIIDPSSKADIRRISRFSLLPTLSSSVRIASWPLPLEDYGVATGLSPSPRVLSSSTRSRIERHPPLSEPPSHIPLYCHFLCIFSRLFHVAYLIVHPRHELLRLSKFLQNHIYIFFYSFLIFLFFLLFNSLLLYFSFSFFLFLSISKIFLDIIQYCTYNIVHLNIS